MKTTHVIKMAGKLTVELSRAPLYDAVDVTVSAPFLRTTFPIPVEAIDQVCSVLAQLKGEKS